MKPADIGYIVCFGLWLFNFLMVQWTRKEDDFNHSESDFFLTLEIICLGFMWIFFGLSKNWW